MDQNDYDEFGNYVGPELDDDSDGGVSDDGAGAEVRAPTRATAPTTPKITRG